MTADEAIAYALLLAALVQLCVWLAAAEADTTTATRQQDQETTHA